MQDKKITGRKLRPVQKMIMASIEEIEFIENINKNNRNSEITLKINCDCGNVTIINK